MNTTEAELIQQSCAGNMDAFEQLILQYERRVYTIAYKYMGNHEDASDMAQEAIIKAYQSIGSFRGDAAFGTWLGKITANQCLDELRKRKKQQTTSLEDTLELEEGSVKKEIESDFTKEDLEEMELEKNIILATIEARKNANPSLKILENLIVYEKPGEYTEDIKEIYGLE